MDQAAVLDLYGQAFYLTVLMILVIVGPSLLVGLIVSTFQAATQINEQTLSFLPRLVTTLATVVFTGPWLISKFMDLFSQIFLEIPHLIG